MITIETQISQSADTTLTNEDCRSFIKDLYWSFDDRQFGARTSDEFNSIELISKNGAMQICVDVIDGCSLKASINIPKKMYYAECSASTDKELTALYNIVDRAVNLHHKYV